MLGSTSLLSHLRLHLQRPVCACHGYRGRPIVAVFSPQSVAQSDPLSASASHSWKCSARGAPRFQDTYFSRRDLASQQTWPRNPSPTTSTRTLPTAEWRSPWSPSLVGESSKTPTSWSWTNCIFAWGRWPGRRMTCSDPGLSVQARFDSAGLPCLWTQISGRSPYCSYRKAPGSPGPPNWR